MFLIATVCCRYYHRLHFIDEEIEAERGSITVYGWCHKVKLLTITGKRKRQDVDLGNWLPNPPNCYASLPADLGNLPGLAVIFHFFLNGDPIRISRKCGVSVAVHITSSVPSPPASFVGGLCGWGGNSVGQS